MLCILFLSLNSSLIIAFLDETLQIYSKREPEIEDVWMDVFGAFFGIAAGLVIQWVRLLVWETEDEVS